ncbi:MAG: tRNA (guanosine(46)-N7)-methyltransferase TrmB [Lautropia sp.]|nr:tRNA (guanosine(46)-N7)-methyltransferase TrmB [Lautropia sp.]
MTETDPVGAAPAPSPGAPEQSPTSAHRHRRSIRSYVLRRSHFSNAQRDAYERLMPVFGLPVQHGPIDTAAAFGRTAPVVLEIGFGMGDTTAEIAARAPDVNFIAVDVHTPGVGALLKLVEQRGLTNLRVIEHDAQAVVSQMIAPSSLDGIHVFFPDPWPKARHHKRRLIQLPFVRQLIQLLKPGGYLHLATDWQHYAEQMTNVLAECEALSESAPGPSASPSLPCPRPSTRFERRGERLGHEITDLIRYRVR